jgi:hypothetical protein
VQAERLAQRAEQLAEQKPEHDGAGRCGNRDRGQPPTQIAAPSLQARQERESERQTPEADVTQHDAEEERKEHGHERRRVDRAIARPCEKPDERLEGADVDRVPQHDRHVPVLGSVHRVIEEDDAPLEGGIERGGEPRTLVRRHPTVDHECVIGLPTRGDGGQPRPPYPYCVQRGRQRPVPPAGYRHERGLDLPDLHRQLFAPPGEVQQRVEQRLTGVTLGQPYLCDPALEQKPRHRRRNIARNREEHPDLLPVDICREDNARTTGNPAHLSLEHVESLGPIAPQQNAERDHPVPVAERGPERGERREQPSVAQCDVVLGLQRIPVAAERSDLRLERCQPNGEFRVSRVAREGLATSDDPIGRRQQHQQFLQTRRHLGQHALGHAFRLHQRDHAKRRARRRGQCANLQDPLGVKYLEGARQEAPRSEYLHLAHRDNHGVAVPVTAARSRVITCSRLAAARRAAIAICCAVSSRTASRTAPSSRSRWLRSRAIS